MFTINTEGDTGDKRHLSTSGTLFISHPQIRMTGKFHPRLVFLDMYIFSHEGCTVNTNRSVLSVWQED